MPVAPYAVPIHPAGRRPRFCSPQGRLTCPSAPAKISTRRHGSPASRQPAFAAGCPLCIRPGIRPVIRQHPVGGPAPTLPLSRCLSATGISFLGVLFPPRNPAPLTVGLPANTQTVSPDLDGVSTFHTHELRPGRAPSLPRGRRCSYDHREIRGRRLPPHNGQPLPPQFHAPTRDVRLTRHQQGFNVVSPSGLPLACNTRSERAPLGFPLSFAPSRYQPRTSRRGQVWNTDLKSHLRLNHTEPPKWTDPLIACDFVSHFPDLPHPARHASSRSSASVLHFTRKSTVFLSSSSN